MIVLESDWICPVASLPIRNGAIAIENGRIAKLGRIGEVIGSNHIRYSGCAIIPGFVNAHAHLELTILKGMFDNLSFAEWIRKMVHIKYQRMTEDDYKLSSRLGASEMLRAGITTVAEVMDIGTGWDAMREFGLRGIAYQEVFGPAESAAEQAMDTLMRKIDRYRVDESQTLHAGVSPHAPYTVSRKLFEHVQEFARKESLRLTAHVAESHDETLFVRDGAGIIAESHRHRGIDVTPRNTTPLGFVNSLGLLGPDMLVAHAVEAGDRDLEVLQRSGTFVAHCPQSNLKLGNSTARVREMRDRGIRVCLGTDSTASNDSIDMFEEMRAACRNGLTPREAFQMATIEGARALGLERELGSLEVGKLADLVVTEVGVTVDPIDYLVANISAAQLKAVYLGGREVSLDNSELWEEAAAVVNRL